MDLNLCESSLLYIFYYALKYTIIYYNTRYFIIHILTKHLQIMVTVALQKNLGPSMPRQNDDTYLQQDQNPFEFKCPVKMISNIFLLLVQINFYQKLHLQKLHYTWLQIITNHYNSYPLVDGETRKMTPCMLREFITYLPDLAIPRPNFGHCREGSFNNPILIIKFDTYSTQGSLRAS